MRLFYQFFLSLKNVYTFLGSLSILHNPSVSSFIKLTYEENLWKGNSPDLKANCEGAGFSNFASRRLARQGLFCCAQFRQAGHDCFVPNHHKLFWCYEKDYPAHIRTPGSFKIDLDIVLSFKLSFFKRPLAFRFSELTFPYSHSLFFTNFFHRSFVN
jgi:hypothetical protein